MARTNPLSAAFWAGADPREPGSYSALEARRRIAEQMAKKSPFPKTFGEGLTYLGESIAEIAQRNALDDAEAKQGNIDRAALAGPAATRPPPAPTAPAEAPLPADAPVAAPQEPPPPPYPTAADAGQLPTPVTAEGLSPLALSAGVTPDQMNTARNRLASGLMAQRNFSTPPGPQAAAPVAPQPLPPLPNALIAALQTPPVRGPDSPSNWGGGKPTEVPTDPASVAPGTFGMRNPAMPAATVSIGRGDDIQIGDEVALPPRTHVASLGGMPNIAAAAADNPPVATDIAPRPQQVADTFNQRFGPAATGPAVPSPAIVQAPRPPMAPNVAGAAVPTPIAPRDPGPEPRPPAPTPEMQHWEQAARNPSLSPGVRNIANAKYNELRTAQREDFTRHWTVWKAEEMKARDPATALDLRHKQLTNVETQRKLEGEGFLPLSKEEMAVLPKAAEGQVIYKNRLGELKFGPAPPATAAESGAQVLQKKMAEHFVSQMEAGNTAADDLRTLAQMRELAARVNTGPEAVIKQFAGQMGLKTEGVSNIEALNAVINRVVPQQRVPGTGSTSDFDAAMFRASVPALMNTPGGNALIMDTMESVARNKLARAEVAGRVVSGELSIPDGTREMLKLQGEAKTMSNRVRAHIEATGGKVPDASATSDNSAAQEWLRNNPNDPRAAAIRRKLGM